MEIFLYTGSIQAHKSKLSFAIGKAPSTGFFWYRLLFFPPTASFHCSFLNMVFIVGGVVNFTSQYASLDAVKIS